MRVAEKAGKRMRRCDRKGRTTLRGATSKMRHAKTVLAMTATASEAAIDRHDGPAAKRAARRRCEAAP